MPYFALIHSISLCSPQTGIGKIYGQLVTLGHKEYLATKDANTKEDSPSVLKAKGERNESFVLQRRGQSNGIRKDTVVVRDDDGNGPNNCMVRKKTRTSERA